ncbi:type I DNA topoisomerase [Chromobacterium violaceum]|uniref:DNA topoisomerase 1 n=1 Tax=Chromobacterium violaceum TaxID=536 RepID=A0A1R0ME42_CHRVL|nr:type I DNA topoisomerase [Chromobacterium violaceum]ATP30446.1 DNA topoisomerase I [Chromobacterium violaceum]ATP34354.1 DNA topoisomerase I [Chromobacterium violaceum]MBT2866053.1 type I DNA topoisomerase [Chromobacterium violaceum]MCD0492525.1 type I DNA topoisomerase [Chromobacterium violaceum]OLZ76407.1 DNA topoisomerase I [Chromobacterium violaceum]
MPTSLLIVESPSKAKTLKKYLGPDFEVLASYGHVRDLVPKNGAVDPEKDFAMKYQLIARNSKHVDAIVSAVREADHVYLATDPDREGEAISWHLVQILNSKKLLKDKTAQRVVFHEITKNAVLDAIQNPRDIAQDLVDAQQARRALDYLVGFNLSPLLWKKIRRGLSAGRVQSPALRLICERENEIKAFVQQEYWSVHLDSHKSRTKFSAKLTTLGGKKLDQFDIPNEAEQASVLARLQGLPATVGSIEKKKKSRSPAAPFTTSTLQQEAVRKLGMTTDRAMRTAQQLYEGMDIGQGTVGLITYMRTDSVALANEAVEEIRGYIGLKWDADYLPKNPAVYKSKAKNAQEAHEAIRPTSILRTPEMVKPFLTTDQFKLYDMIWKRTLACQMAPAKFDTTSVDILVGEGVFRASGQVQTFAGFLAVYEEDVDDAEDEDNAKLPLLTEGEDLPVDKLYGEQHFTQPPPRFSEASLVKALEEFGIGRPSTYASIISTLKDREYVILDKKRFLPTDTGDIVNKFLTEHFAQYVDYNFTAKLENQLDEIANGGRQWVPVMDTFWKGFKKQIDEKESISRAEVTTESLDEDCPKCGKPLSIKFGKRGRFIACTGYPECDYTRNMGETAEQAAEEAEAPTVIEGRSCPDCGGELHIKKGRYGKFIGCANYPKCKHIEPLEKPRETGVTCPECKTGQLIERKSRYGKLFYSCNTYPKCKYATWNPPIAEPCPQCNWPILTIKTTKRRGTEKVCPQKECGYAEQIAPPEGKDAAPAEEA